MEFMTLKNIEGKEISVCFRKFQPSDATEIVKLIRDEYGEKYHKRRLYDPDYIIQQNESGDLKFHVAELDGGEVIGCLALKREGTAYSIATGIILKHYRRYGMFFPFAKYIAAQIRKLENVSAIYCRMILYHNVTQKLMARLGLKACAFVPSLILADKFQHSYDRDDNLKLTLGIMIRKASKHNAGKIYLPVEQIKIAQDIYNSLKVKYEIDSAENILADKSKISVDNDAVQQNCTIAIDFAGADLINQIRAVHDKFSGTYQTFNIFLNISDKSAVTAYNELIKLGYFFTGLNPICSDKEIMILHNPRNVPIKFDELKLINEFEFLREYVKKMYESRCLIEKNQ